MILWHASRHAKAECVKAQEAGPEGLWCANDRDIALSYGPYLVKVDIEEGHQAVEAYPLSTGVLTDTNDWESEPMELFIRPGTIIKCEMEGFTMGKLSYEHEGVVYEIDGNLADKWLKREGIRNGTPQAGNAMECVIANAKGRLELEGINPTKEAMELAMEEVIREEIQLTGGEV